MGCGKWIANKGNDRGVDPWRYRRGVGSKAALIIDAGHKAAADFNTDSSTEIERKEVSENMLVVNENKCVGCGQCVPFCPTEALKVWGIAEVIPENCTECLECIDYCPVDALEVKE